MSAPCIWAQFIELGRAPALSLSARRKSNTVGTDVIVSTNSWTRAAEAEGGGGGGGGRWGGGGGGEAVAGRRLADFLGRQPCPREPEPFWASWSKLRGPRDVRQNRPYGSHQHVARGPARKTHQSF